MTIDELIKWIEQLRNVDVWSHNDELEIESRNYYCGRIDALDYVLNLLNNTSDATKSDETDSTDRQNSLSTGIRSYNIGSSDYSKHKIQPWDIWEDYSLNPWDADIVKRVLRTKAGENRADEYRKIIHICLKRLEQLGERF